VHLHGNAKLVPSNRRLLVGGVLEERWKVADVAAAFGISERTVYRWLARRRGGDVQLLDFHLDVKKLGRFDRPGHRVTGRRVPGWGSRAAGWEFVHVVVDDCTRLAYVSGGPLYGRLVVSAKTLRARAPRKAGAPFTGASLYRPKRCARGRLVKPSHPLVDWRTAERRLLSRVGFFLFAETLRAWVGQL
jgi:hypothetical protein